MITYSNDQGCVELRIMQEYLLNLALRSLKIDKGIIHSLRPN